jgi:hypothetical protein
MDNSKTNVFVSWWVSWLPDCDQRWVTDSGWLVKFGQTWVMFFIPPFPEGGGGYTVLPLSILPSVQDIFRRTFLSNCWWQKSDIWSQHHIGIPYRGKHFWTHQIPTSCLPTLLIFIHIEHICSFFVALFSATIDDRDLIFGHKLHIGTPYRGKCFWIHQIPTSCLPKSGGIISEH